MNKQNPIEFSRLDHNDQCDVVHHYQELYHNVCVEDLFDYFEKENPFIYTTHSNEPFLTIKELMKFEESIGA